MLSLLASLLASATAAQYMPPQQQNALVRKYCATRHADAARNGGLSLEHYDAARVNQALAAMLLNGRAAARITEI
jgi:hypothetical protein